MHQFYVFFIFTGTQNQTYGAVLTFGHIILFEPTEIQLHLSLITGLEFTKFQVNCNKTTQTAMIEEQVDVIILIIYCNTFLSGKECKIIAQFGYKILKFCNNCIFKIFFGIGVMQSEKIEDIRILEYKVSRHLTFIAQLI